MRVTFKFFNPSVTEITDHCVDLVKPCTEHTVRPGQIIVIVDSHVLPGVHEAVGWYTVVNDSMSGRKVD